MHCSRGLINHQHVLPQIRLDPVFLMNMLAVRQQCILYQKHNHINSNLKSTMKRHVRVLR